MLSISKFGQETSWTSSLCSMWCKSGLLMPLSSFNSQKKKKKSQDGFTNMWCLHYLEAHQISLSPWTSLSFCIWMLDLRKVKVEATGLLSLIVEVWKSLFHHTLKVNPSHKSSSDSRWKELDYVSSWKSWEVGTVGGPIWQRFNPIFHLKKLINRKEVTQANLLEPVTFLAFPVFFFLFIAKLLEKFLFSLPISSPTTHPLIHPKRIYQL